MYVDSGILLKAFVAEPESDAVQAVLATAEDVTCSELLLAEFQSALARKCRERQLDAFAANACMMELRRTIGDGAINMVKMESSTIEAAVKLLSTLAGDIPLRTLDAIHLAVCLEHKLFPLFATDGVMVKAARHLKIPLVALCPTPRKS